MKRFHPGTSMAAHSYHTFFFTSWMLEETICDFLTKLLIEMRAPLGDLDFYTYKTTVGA